MYGWKHIRHLSINLNLHLLAQSIWSFIEAGSVPYARFHVNCIWPIAGLDEDLELGEGISIGVEGVDNELCNAVVVMMREEYTKCVAEISAAIDGVDLSYSIYQCL
jgi:hypothetical protein